MKPIYIGAEPLAQFQRQGVRVTTLTDFKALPDDVQLIPEKGDWINAEDVMRSAKRIDELLGGTAKAPLLIDVVAQLEKDLPVLIEIAKSAKAASYGGTRIYAAGLLEKIKHLL